MRPATISWPPLREHARLTGCEVARYHADPSGTFMRYDAKAIGSGSEGAQSELQDSYTKVRELQLSSHTRGYQLTVFHCIHSR